MRDDFDTLDEYHDYEPPRGKRPRVFIDGQEIEGVVSVEVGLLRPALSPSTKLAWLRWWLGFLAECRVVGVGAFDD